MSYLTNNDNIYQVGAIVRAKSAPDSELRIAKYFHRTYYCVVVGDDTQKYRTYFEKELLSPQAALKLAKRTTVIEGPNVLVSTNGPYLAKSRR
jgi:hypothetical protein